LGFGEGSGVTIGSERLIIELISSWDVGLSESSGFGGGLPIARFRFKSSAGEVSLSR